MSLARTRTRPGSRSFNLADVDLRLLKVLHAVVRCGGFSAAQSELGLSGATISNHMARLEDRLGVRLCDRGRRGFSLTEDGARIHEASLSLFRSIDNFSGIVGSVRGELTGQVHFGTVDAMYTNAALALPKALRRFYELAPKVVIDIETASPQLLHQRLLHGRYFLILTPIQAPDTSIRAQPLFEETQALYCGRGHPLFSLPARALKPAMFGDYPYAARSYMPDWSSPDGVAFQTAATTAHMESLAMLILSGRYLGYLPCHYARAWEDSGEMRSLLPERMSYVDTFYLAHLANEKNRAMSTLAACIRELVGTDPLPRY